MGFGIIADIPWHGIYLVIVIILIYCFIVRQKSTDIHPQEEDEEKLLGDDEYGLESI